MIIEKNINHVQEALNRLISPFIGKPNIEKFITVFANECQRFEDIAFDLIKKRFLANAYGSTLDLIGQSIGQNRPLLSVIPMTDDTYRSLIYAKIAENTSNGTREELINILRLLGANDIYIQRIYPASITVNIRGNVLLPTQEVKKTLERSSLPIELDLVQYYLEPFGFSGDNSALGFSVGVLGS